jgi:carbonic anhydrase/acetyltransferase-like protein (isoleucine patch superfamily)
MPTHSLGTKKPKIHGTAVLAPSATIIGDVVIGPRTSIWPGAVIRGDYGYIRIGSDCSIQDNAVIHCSAENPTIIGNGVTVAHGAVVHACQVGDECLIGVGAVIFDGASVGTHSILGVGSAVLGGGRIPPRSVAVGAPAKVIRRATKSDLRLITESYKAYVRMGQRYVKLGTFKQAVG